MEKMRSKDAGWKRADEVEAADEMETWVVRWRPQDGIDGRVPALKHVEQVDTCEYLGVQMHEKTSMGVLILKGLNISYGKLDHIDSEKGDVLSFRCLDYSDIASSSDSMTCPEVQNPLW